MRPGYKQTEVGVIPEDWEVVTGEQVTSLITKGASPRWQGFSYSAAGMLFVTSENVRDGYLDLSRPKFLPIEFHEKIIRSRIEKDDVLINLVGASIGRSCLIRRELGEANINQAVAVFRPRGGVDPEFLAFCFQLPATVARILGMQVEAARPNISLGDLRKFSLPLPPLPEQRVIAEALADVDAAVAGLERLIAKKRDLKQAAMQQLLTGQTRLPGFSGAWEVKRLGEILEYEQPTAYLVESSEYSDAFETPVLTAGKSFLLGRTNERTGICTKLPVILFDDFTTATQLVDFPFKVKSSAMKLLRPRSSDINITVVHEIMRNVEFIMSDHKRYWISEFQHQAVLVPGVNEQTAIATVLSDMDAELAELQAQLDKTRLIKQAMMQDLLTGRVRLPFQ